MDSISPVPDCTTRHSASFSPGIIADPASTMARTGVIPGVPIMVSMPMRAPTQCDRSMASWVLQPGMKYLLPPEKPTTSCGKTGPMMTMWS